MTVSVLLADDEGLIRSALATLLPLEADIEVVAEADNGVDALARYEELRPDVAVLDLEMPGFSGVDVATKLLADDQTRAVVILTRHARPGTLRSALRVGVRGFVGKDADPKLIASAVTDVAAGGRYIDPNVSAQALIDDCPLTEREIDVLRVAVDGYSVSEIAATLHLAEGTVRNYLSNAIQKTGSRTRHEAARTARERDWL